MHLPRLEERKAIAVPSSGRSVQGSPCGLLNKGIDPGPKALAPKTITLSVRISNMNLTVILTFGHKHLNYFFIHIVRFLHI